MNQGNKYENDYSILHLRKDFLDVLKTFGRPCFPTVKSALAAWKEAGGVEKIPDALSEEEANRQIEMATKELEAYKLVTAESNLKATEAKIENKEKAKELLELQKQNEAGKKTVQKLRKENPSSNLRI